MAKSLINKCCINLMRSEQLKITWIDLDQAYGSL